MKLYGWSSLLKTRTALIVSSSERIFCFDEVFLIELTSREQLFIERPLYKRFLHNNHLPTSINYLTIPLKKISAMLSALQIFIFHKQPLEVFC